MLKPSLRFAAASLFEDFMKRSTFFMVMDSNLREVRCLHNNASNEDHFLCDWCQSIRDYNPPSDWVVPLEPHEHEAALRMFGGPSLPSRKRWDLLGASLMNSPDVEWARLPDDQDPIAELPCSEEEFKHLAENLTYGSSLSKKQESILNEGIRFHDGTSFRVMGDTLYLDDTILPSKLSLPSLLKVLADRNVRCGWDLPQLILALASIAPIKSQHHHEFYRWQRRRGGASGFRPMVAMLTWISTKVTIDGQKNSADNRPTSWSAWANDTQDATGNIPPERVPESWIQALANRPPGLFEHCPQPWMERWKNQTEDMFHAETSHWPIQSNSKQFSFRIRTKAGKTRLVQLPDRPILWAFFCSAALSPIASETGKLLLALQYNWTHSYLETSPPAPELIRSMEFCHDILNGLDGRVYMEKARVLVIGKLGHFYEINVGHGQHGAPYHIRHLLRVNSRENQNICIHSGRHPNRLPLGDTMASTVLSMYNDTRAAKEIDSLASILLQVSPIGFPVKLTDAWAGMVNPEAILELQASTKQQYGGWFRVDEDFEEYDDEEGPFGGMGRMVQRHRRARHIMANQSLQRDVSPLFAEAVAEGESLPHDALVEQWRSAVPDYTPAGLHRSRRRMDAHYNHAMLRRFMRQQGRNRYHLVGDARDGERRWRETFARVWDGLLALPLGSHFRIPSVDGGALTFDHIQLQITIRNLQERGFFRQVATLLGYVYEREEEGELVFLRRDHPRPNARLRLTELLERFQRDAMPRGMPPRWWAYSNPQGAPDELGAIPWRLEEDLRDQPVRQTDAVFLDPPFINHDE